MLQKEELRKKIKQLKYKIEKEEYLNKELVFKVKVLKDLQREELGSERIMKKINFQLGEKGMNFKDWLNCLPYDEKFHIDSLIEIGDSLGLHLNREEKDFMVNFMADDLSVDYTPEDWQEELKKSGIRMN